jgi:hypothetical protein
MSHIPMNDHMNWDEDNEVVETHEPPAESSVFAVYDASDEEVAAEEEPSILPPIPAIQSRSIAGTIWDITDLDYEISERFKGPTMDSYRRDYQDYVRAIKSLPAYDPIAIREEIANWDLSVPSSDEFHYDVIKETYSRMVAYRNRLTYLHDLVNPHYELINDAVKNLKALAFKLTTGTLRDKESTATNLVLPLAKALPEIVRLKTNLEAVSRNIEFATLQMDRLMKERQSLAKINQGYVSEGMGQAYVRQQAIASGEEGASRCCSNGYFQSVSKPAIRTRNHRLKP